MSYRMAPLPVRVEDHFCCLKPFISHIRREIPGILYNILSTICLHVNQKAHMAWKFNYLFDNEGLSKVVARHVLCI